jgi:hypothetical protein
LLLTLTIKLFIFILKIRRTQLELTDFDHANKYCFKTKELKVSYYSYFPETCFVIHYSKLWLSFVGYSFLGGWSLFLISLVCSMYYACVQSLMFKHYYCLLLLVCMPTTYQHSLLHNTHNAQNTFTSMM